MLTLPSEPLPQTVLMEPLPSIPPSFMSYGVSGSRRSPRKHHVMERRPALKPYDKTSAHSRARHSTDTALASHSVPSRLERTPPKPQTQERLDISVSTENICGTLTRPKISSQKPCVSPLSDSSHLDADAKPKPSSLDPDTAPRGWVIGPLFQSLKSKMASFTEIVMSPFKSSEVASVESTGDGYVTAEEDENQQSEHKKSPPKHGVEDEEGTGLTCKISDNSEARFQSNVPSQTLKTELESSAIQSAWNPNTTAFTTTSATAAAASFCKALDVAEEASVSLGVRARKRPNKSALKEAKLCDIKDEAQGGKKDMDCNFLTCTDSDFEKLSGFNAQGDGGDSQADQTPTSPSILEEASLKKVKRTLDLNCDTGKRKKTEEGAEREESDKKRKPKLNEGCPDAGQALKTITKAVTRANHKKCKVDPEDTALKICNGQDVGNLVDSGTSEDPKCAKAKAKTTKSTKTKGDQSLDLQTSTLNTLTTAMALKPNGKITVTSKKRKAKDDLSVKSDVNAHTSLCAAVETVSTEPPKMGQNLKKIKTKDCTVEFEVKLSRGVTEKVSFEMALPESDAPQMSEPDEAANEKGMTKRRARRMDPQRRRSRAIHGTKSPTKRRAEDTCLSQDDSEAFRKGSATRLLRSVSCPEIPTLRLHEAPWTPHFHSPPRSRSQPPQQQHVLPHSLSSSSSLAQHFHRSARRTRRHTVCSLEVEREIAPLCLRKEVYPARRSPSPYDPQHISPMRVLSPGTSLSALASCFLSSPLAFLSKKSEGGTRSSVASPTRALSPTVRLVSLSPSPSSSGPSLTSLLGTSLGQLPGFHLRTDTLLNASCNATNSTVGLLDCAPDQPPAPDEDEDTSSSSPESEELREETTHSDSELKVLKKDQGHRKVSSIKIRKALPKPQNNLTPMGLPKAVRVKKKEFSLEEIYTNKNFSKPPESRLETIFEVPLSRKNGSESWCGPRRLKRFLEFPELGEARRPRKLLTGATKATTTKTNNSSSRPRRGGGREDPALGSDPDSMLCAKLEQLGLWMQQNHG